MKFGTVEQVISGEARCCLLRGDCRKLLALVPDNCIDSIVTDAPYEIAFSGKNWDRTGIAFDASMWRECLRVLKPGGHLACFGASRTYHRLACAIEDAGFEIRDTIDMIYGSGAAHSKDASKAIDLLDGTFAQRPVIGSYTVSGNAGTPTSEKGGTFGVGVPNSEEKTLFRTTGATERSQRWDGWQSTLSPGKEPVVLARKPLDGTLAENLIKWGVGALNVDGCRIATDFSERGEAWARSGHTADPEADKIGNPPGQGMLLHPKGRWPKNVVWIHDGRCQKLGQKPSRSPRVNRHVGGPRFFDDTVGAEFVSDGGEPTTETIWECHPDCPVAKLSEMSEVTLSTGGRIGKLGTSAVNNFASGLAVRADGGYGDEGTAARYFTQLEWTEPDFELWRYVKKCSTAEREVGCESIEPKRANEITKRKAGSAAMSCPSTGTGRSTEGRHNDHSTVKPIEFMRWLIRLVTPPNGVTLSPFVGSGTDAIAGQAEGMRTIGFDLDEHDRNIRIAKARVEFWTEDDCRRLRSESKPKLIKKNPHQVSLFGDEP